MGNGVCMGIDPHHAQAPIGMGLANASDGGGSRGVITSDHDWEQPALQGGGHQCGRVPHHAGNRLDMACVGGCGGGAQLRGSGTWPCLTFDFLNQPIADLAQPLLTGSGLLEQINARTSSRRASTKVTIDLHQGNPGAA